MIKKLHLTSGAAIICCFAALSLLLGNSSGPGGDNTGGPFSSSANACGQCHSGNSNPGPGITISGLPTDYYPGASYTVTLSINNATLNNGFQVVALDGTNANAGSFTAGFGSSAYTFGGRNYLQHNSLSTTGSWTFTWTAPTSNLGDVTFYASGNASNGNGNTSGDNVFIDNTTIGGLSQITATNTTTDVLCNGQCTGEITLSNTSGGAGSPFTYAWSNNGSGLSETSLCAGAYSITITDVSGNTEVIQTTVTEPTFLSNNPTATDATCAASDGAIQVNATGGVQPYSYDWSGPNGNTTISTDLYSGLQDGLYLLTITDANGCTSTLAQNVGVSSSGLVGATTTTPENCNGQDGTASITITGGTGVYGYNWSNGAFTDSIANMSNGTYSVTVTDQGTGCSDVFQAFIGAQGGPQFTSVQVSDPLCYGDSNGTVSVSVAQGQAPYTYQWFPNVSMGSTASNLPASSYLVVISDSNGCSIDTTLNLGEPDSLSLSFNVIDELCFGQNAGEITSTIQGGTSPFQFQWNSGASTADISGLQSGYFSVTVTDSNNCVISDSAFVDGPEQPIVTDTLTVIGDTNGFCTGTLVAAATGGNGGPFSYAWNDPDSQQDSVANGLCAGEYSLSITDNQNCQVVTVFTVPGITTSIEEGGFEAFTSVYPQPMTDELFIETSSQIERVLIFTLQGHRVDVHASINGNSAYCNTSGLPRGTYVIQLETTTQRINQAIIK